MDIVSSSGGVVFNKDDKSKCWNCHSLIPESYNALFCPKCGRTIITLPKNISKENYVSIFELVQKIANRVQLLLTPEINEYIFSLQSTIKPWTRISIFVTDESQEIQDFEKSLCNSAILTGFALRLIEEVYYKPKRYKFPSDFINKTEEFITQSRYGNKIGKDWKKDYRDDEVLEINLLTNYLVINGVIKYILLETELFSQVYQMLVLVDSEFQNLKLNDRYGSLQEEFSATMVLTGYALGIAFSFYRSANTQSSTRSFYTNDFKRILEESKITDR